MQKRGAKAIAIPSSLGKTYAIAKLNRKIFPDLEDVLSDKKLEQLSNLIKTQRSWENE